MLMALLVPDPGDLDCPEDFKQCARNILPRVQGVPGPSDVDLRNELFRFISDFANWGNATNALYLDAARGLVRAGHGDEPPLVVDPFAGGGSIPLEALRLGCDAFASDLNPVAVIILKTVLEEIPRSDTELSGELLKVSSAIKRAMEERLNRYYPGEPNGSNPIAYLWSRTVVCDTCGAEIPLVRSFWLSKKVNDRRALRYLVSRTGKIPHLKWEIFQPDALSDVQSGNVRRAKAVCLCCNSVMPPSRVKAQLAQQQGGADVAFEKNGHREAGATLLAVVTSREQGSGRAYRLPRQSDYDAIHAADAECRSLGHQIQRGLTVFPNEATPAGGGSGAGRAFSIQSYGMATFANLFTARQKVALAAVMDAIRSQQNVSVAAKHILGLAMSRVTDIFNALCRWESTKTQVRNLFTRQAISMVWDFAEQIHWRVKRGITQRRWRRC